MLEDYSPGEPLVALPLAEVVDIRVIVGCSPGVPLVGQLLADTRVSVENTGPALALLGVVDTRVIVGCSPDEPLVGQLLVDTRVSVESMGPALVEPSLELARAGNPAFGVCNR